MFSKSTGFQAVSPANTGAKKGTIEGQLCVLDCPCVCCVLRHLEWGAISSEGACTASLLDTCLLRATGADAVLKTRHRTSGPVFLQLQRLYME